MKKILARILLLFFIFCGVGVGIYYKVNHTQEENENIESKKKLPVIYMTYDGVRLNGLYGYSQDMKVGYIRGALTPLKEDRVLKVQIDSRDNRVSALSYEVRTLDQSRLLERTEVQEWNEKDGIIQTDFAFENLIEEGNEYLLTIFLTTEEGEKASYYTRIMQGVEEISKKIGYVMDFSQKTFDKEAAKDLIPYLESGPKGDNTNFGKVNIYSSFAQITWDELLPEKVTEPVPVIHEIQGDITNITLTYLVKADNMYGTEEYYEVTEYFRTRYTPDRMYLLDYNRDMQQFFKGVSDNINSSRINLGIQSDDKVRMKASLDGNIAAFVINGEVWAYQSKANEIVAILRRSSVYNLEAWKQHDIELIDVDDRGNVTYVVYGYLDNGIREGENGLSFQRYTAETGKTEEILYIPYEKSYGYLKESLGRLFTLTSDNSLYFMLEGNLYVIDLASGEYMLTVSGLSEGSYVINQMGNILAWQTDEELGGAKNIHVLLLEENREFTISAEDGKLLRVLGFIGDDIVYGCAKREDIFQTVNGSIGFYMSELIILDKNQKQAGSYGREGYYFTTASMTNNMITLTQFTKEGEQFVPAEEEHIMNNTAEETESLSATIIATEKKKKELGINLIKPVGSGSLISKEAIELEQEENKIIFLEGLPDEYFSYLIYAKGGFYKATNSISDAIQIADEAAGVVVDKTGDTAWSRQKKNDSKLLSGISSTKSEKDSLFLCVDIMLKYAGIMNSSEELFLQGKTTIEILNTFLDGKAMDLTGCTMKEVLYFVDRGQPVMGRLKEGYVLIIGFDSYNAVLYNANTGNSYKIGLEDGTEAFAEMGNEFISYSE